MRAISLLGFLMDVLRRFFRAMKQNFIGISQSHSRFGEVLFFARKSQFKFEILVSRVSELERGACTSIFFCVLVKFTVKTSIFSKKSDFFELILSFFKD